MFKLKSLILGRILPHNWKTTFASYSHHIHACVRKKEEGRGKERHKLTLEYNLLTRTLPQKNTRCKERGVKNLDCVARILQIEMGEWC